VLERLFNHDSSFWRAMGWVADVVWLNVLVVASCLPVVTAGAGLTALTDTARRLSQDADRGVTRTFLASFRANLRQGTALWLVVGPTGLALLGSWVFLRLPELLVLKVLLSTVYLLTFPLVWAMQARFDNDVLSTLRNALVVTFARLPLSAAVLAAHAVFAALFVSVLAVFPQGLFLLVMLGYPLVALAVAPLLERTLQPLLAQA